MEMTEFPDWRWTMSPVYRCAIAFASKPTPNA